jgi:hypothetical protein
MRLLVLLSVFVALAGTSASAASATVDRTPGGVYVEFQRGAGSAKVRFRGNFFGLVGHGRIVATKNVNLSGCASRESVSDTLMVCRGDRIKFRTLAGTTWRVRLIGRGIFTTGFVAGCMTLDARNSGPTGVFKIGASSNWRAWPRLARTYRLGSGC